jgi:hypothetical protein
MSNPARALIASRSRSTIRVQVPSGAGDLDRSDVTPAADAQDGHDLGVRCAERPRARIERAHRNPIGLIVHAAVGPQPSLESVPVGTLEEHARQDVTKIDEPKARALFVTTAEVLNGLITAYEPYERAAEPAWK